MENVYPDAKQFNSPYSSSRDGFAPEAVVLHVMDGTLAGCDSWFLNNPHGVSAHLGMSDTETHQYVKFDQAAHANGGIEGTGYNLKLIKENAYQNPNDWTVSIEMQGWGPTEPTHLMFERAAKATAWVFLNVLFPGGATGVAIDRDHILKHSDISPSSRRNCPGWSEATMTSFIKRVQEWYDYYKETPEDRAYKAGYSDGRVAGIQAARDAVNGLS